MRGYRLSIIRHGSTESAKTGVYAGITDLPLSPEGRAELEKKRSEMVYPKVNKVYSSPLSRCMQSAEIIFPDRELMVVDELREMNFGDFEGLKAEDLLGLESYKDWLKGGMDAAPPNGESIREMILRSYNAIQKILFDMMRENLTHCGVVTHSGIMMNMLSCFGLPKMKPMEFACPPGEGYEIIITTQLWQMGGTFEILGRVPYEAGFEEDYDF